MNLKNNIFLAIVAVGFSLLSIPQTVFAEDEIATTTPDPSLETATTTPETSEESTLLEETASSTPGALVRLMVRFENEFLFNDTVTLQPTITFPYVEAGQAGLITTTAGNTVLSVVAASDAANDSFSISDLTYFPSFGSFYLNCISPGNTSTVACGSWNYAVNGVGPSIGMDKYLLSGDETIVVYFSTPWRVMVSSSTPIVGATTTFTSQKYQFDNLTEPWAVDPNTQILISAPNGTPPSPWSTTPVITLTSNENGVTTYAFPATGTYYANITATDFSKWSDPVTLSVMETPVVPTPTNSGNENAGSNSSSGSNSGGTPPNTVPSETIRDTVNRILAYARSQQTADGAIIDGQTSEWLAMSFAAANIHPADVSTVSSSLQEFLKNYQVNSNTEINACAGYPRHILALLASGIATTDARMSDVVNRMTSPDCYTNHDYGSSGINDDVFAFLAMVATGQTQAPLTIDLFSDLVAHQNSDGGFILFGTTASPDITGAVLNALLYGRANGFTVPDDSITRAKTYLHTTQRTDGGWGFENSDAITTAWAMMGVNAAGEDQLAWSNSQGNNPWGYLTSAIKPAGYYEFAPGIVDWFGTKHVVPALLGKSWPIVSTPRAAATNQNQDASSSGGSSGGSASGVPDVTATTTPATSTLLEAGGPPPEDQVTTTPVIDPIIFDTDTSSTPVTTQDSVIPPLPVPVRSTIAPSSLVSQTAPPTTTPAEPSPIFEMTNELVETEATTTLSAATGLPLQKAAKGVFGGAAALAGTLGVYLAWRLVQSLV